MTLIKLIWANEAYNTNQYKNLNIKVLKYIVNIDFNKQCIKRNLIQTLQKLAYLQ